MEATNIWWIQHKYKFHPVCGLSEYFGSKQPTNVGRPRLALIGHLKSAVLRSFERVLLKSTTQ